MSEELMPDKNGRFGIYGGRYVAETLVPALEELSEQYEIIKNDENFLKEFTDDLKYYVGRPSPLYFAKRWTELLGGAKIFLKREDLNHTGAHKINNTVGQILLAKHMVFQLHLVSNHCHPKALMHSHKLKTLPRP